MPSLVMLYGKDKMVPSALQLCLDIQSARIAAKVAKIVFLHKRYLIQTCSEDPSSHACILPLCRLEKGLQSLQDPSLRKKCF